MKVKAKVVLITVFLLAVAVGFYFLTYRLDKAGNTVADNTFGWKYPTTAFPKVGPRPEQLAYSTIRDPGGIPQGLPVRIRIPVIGVNSVIEDALITTDGRMDVPVGSVNVAWFALGPHPGQVGSAVIGGHFGISNGVKFVFYDLDKLKAGDKVFIIDDKGDSLAFIVRRTQLFDRDADATTVFTSSDGLAHLNLITCEGVWNQVDDSYPQRLVVFTDSIPSEEPATAATAPPKATTKPETPESVSPIPPTSEPTPGEEAATPTPGVQLVSPSFPETFIQYVKSSYATPTDSLVTSLLLISIALMVNMITRRQKFPI